MDYAHMEFPYVNDFLIFNLKFPLQGLEFIMTFICHIFLVSVMCRVSCDHPITFLPHKIGFIVVPSKQQEILIMNIDSELCLTLLRLLKERCLL